MNARHEAAVTEYLTVETHARPRPEVLVIWESRDGSAAEISYAIAEVLRSAGLRVTVADAAKGYPDREFDAYVIGSGIHHGHWMKKVKQFAHDARQTLLTRPVWLFSVLPVDHQPTPDDAPLDIAYLYWCSAPKNDILFAGNVDRAKLPVTERVLSWVSRSPHGDFRDWDAIRTWAQGIAGAMTHAVQGGQSRG